MTTLYTFIKFIEFFIPKTYATQIPRKIGGELFYALFMKNNAKDPESLKFPGVKFAPSLLKSVFKYLFQTDKPNTSFYKKFSYCICFFFII